MIGQDAAGILLRRDERCLWHRLWSTSELCEAEAEQTLGGHPCGLRGPLLHWSTPNRTSKVSPPKRT